MVEAIAFGATVISTESGASGILKEASGGKLQIVKDGDWVGFTKAISTINAATTTPTAYYNNYYWGNVIKKVLPALSN